HPAGAVLDRVEQGQKKVAPRPRRAPAIREVVVRRAPLAPLPKRLRLAKQTVDRRHLLGGRGPPCGAYVQLGGGDLSGDLVHPDRAGLELGRAGLWVRGGNGRGVGRGLVGKG